MSDHPLNVQPVGNSFFSKQKQSQKSYFYCLSHELVLEVMSRIGPVCVVKLLQTGKELYPFGMEDSLWRQFTIEEFGGKFQFKKNWKNTFKYNKMNGLEYVEDIPIKLEGFYSDLLYHSWRCATVDIEELTKPDVCTIDKRSNLSLQEFLNEYAFPQIPVIITDAIENWESYKNWDFDFFLNRKTDRPYTAESVQIDFKNYYEYLTTTIEESPLYLFDKHALHDPDLKDSFQIPQYFPQSLFNLLPSPPDNTWLIIGPQRSGSTFHIDPNSTSAWNASIKGRKKWILYPPSTPPPGVYPLKDGSEVTSPVSLVEWYLNHYDNLDRTIVKEGTVNEGEMMYIPQKWWHSVLNLDNSIAITQNFVSEFNLCDVLRFCKYKSGQVSGYNGDLHTEFVDVLKRFKPEILKNVDDRLLEPKRERKRRWDVMIEESVEFIFDFNDVANGSNEDELKEE